MRQMKDTRLLWDVWFIACPRGGFRFAGQKTVAARVEAAARKLNDVRGSNCRADIDWPLEVCVRLPTHKNVKGLLRALEKRHEGTQTLHTIGRATNARFRGHAPSTRGPHPLYSER